jgi:hypothetical protein
MVTLNPKLTLKPGPSPVRSWGVHSAAQRLRN